MYTPTPDCLLVEPQVRDSWFIDPTTARARRVDGLRVLPAVQDYGDDLHFVASLAHDDARASGLLPLYRERLQARTLSGAVQEVEERWPMVSTPSRVRQMGAVMGQRQQALREVRLLSALLERAQRQYEEVNGDLMRMAPRNEEWGRA